MSDDVVLRGSRFGDAVGPQVLLLHGGGQTRHAWERTAVVLAAAGYCANTVDLRGHGESDHARNGRYRLDDFVHDVAQVAESAPSKPFVVGASLGGLAALLAEGERYRSLFRALLLVDVVPHFELSGAERVVEFMRSHADGFENLDQASDAVAGYLPHRRRSRDLEGLKKNLIRTDEGRWVWRYDPAMLADEFVDEALSSVDRLARASHRIEIPTLLIRGQMSDMVTAHGIERFLDLIPHARTVEVVDAAHMVAGDNNAAFTSSVLEFLRAQETETCIHGQSATS